MAKHFGASKVVSAAGHDYGVEFVKALGADIVVDYYKGSVYDAVEDGSVDLVYDNLGRQSGVDKAMAKLKSPGGVFVAIAGPVSPNPPPGVEQVKYNVWSPEERKTYGAKLDQMAKLIDDGKLKVKVNNTYDFDHVKDAYRQCAGGGVLSQIAVVPHTRTEKVYV